jgi:hypothetical protein
MAGQPAPKRESGSPRLIKARYIIASNKENMQLFLLIV